MGRSRTRLPRRIGVYRRTTEFPPNEWSPAEVERRILDDSVEWLYVFDPAGRQIARFRGTPDEVDLSDELKARTGGLYGDPVLKDHSMVHNHPPRAVPPEFVPTFPPSIADVLLAVECDLKQFVIVSGHWRYVLRRPGDTWPTDEHGLVQILQDKQEELARELGPVMSGEAAAVARLLVVLDRLSEEGWIDYATAALPHRVR